MVVLVTVVKMYLLFEAVASVPMDIGEVMVPFSGSRTMILDPEGGMMRDSRGLKIRKLPGKT
jgi:hypothetical protein